MEHLTQQQITYLKDLLDSREQVLRADIRRELLLQDSQPQMAAGTLDSGDSLRADLSADLGNVTVTRDMAELRAIQLARKRIESGRYGECVECGYEIPYERLKAQPTAERCVSCQGRHEKGRI